MKRVLRVLLGILLLAVGIASAALGGLGIATFGREGVIEGRPETLVSDPNSAAIIADLEGVSVSLPMADSLGVPTMRVSGSSGGALFLGIGPQASVDAFLFGVPYDLASRDGSWDTTPVPGVEAKATAPSTQEFWTARSQGQSPSLDLPLQGSPGTLVIMNADGSPGMAVEAVVEFRSERAFWYSVAAIAVGAVLLVIGAALVVRRKRRGKDQPNGADVDDARFGELLQEPAGGSPPVREA